MKRSVTDVPSKYFTLFKQELHNLGYFTTDTLRNGPCGDNTRLLDTYFDADCLNHKYLPDWFKEYPIVLVDRDRIYENGSIIRQLRGGY